MTNREEKFNRINRLRHDQAKLYDRLLRDMGDENADYNKLYYEYDLEYGRISAEITAILNSIARDSLKERGL